jgi:hypothetical protein
MVLNQPRQIALKTPISKITREKWTRDVTQVVGHLLCKHEALNSNPNCTRKKKKKKTKIILILYF